MPWMWIRERTGIVITVGVLDIELEIIGTGTKWRREEDWNMGKMGIMDKEGLKEEMGNKI